MKEKILKNKKVFIAIFIVLIVAILITFVKYNKSLEFKAGTRIEVYLPNGYEKEDIEQICKESFSNKFIIQDIEKLNQVVSIKIENYSEDELNNLKSKMIEKYEIEEDELTVYEIKVPGTRIRSVINQYTIPALITILISTIYIGIRNIKNKGTFKKMLELILDLVIVIGAVFGIIIMARIPFSIYTMPIVFTIYLIALIIIVYKISTSEE